MNQSIIMTFTFLLTIKFHYAFFLFFLITDVHFLIPADIAQIFNPTAEMTITMGIPTNKSKADTETHPEIVGREIRKCLVEFKHIQTFLCFLLMK